MNDAKLGYYNKLNMIIDDEIKKENAEKDTALLDIAVDAVISLMLCDRYKLSPEQRNNNIEKILNLNTHRKTMKTVKVLLAAAVIAALMIVTVIATGDKQQIKATVERFYSLSYDIQLSMEEKDLSDVLDTDSLFGENYVIVFSELNRQRRYLIDKYDYIESSEIPEYEIIFKNIEVDKDSAVCKIGIKTDLEEPQPWFSCPGTIRLAIIDGRWKIVSIEADDNLFIEMNKNEFKEVSDKELYARIDAEMGT